MTTLPTSSAMVSAGWLNAVLTDDVRGGRQVADVTATVIGEGVGFLGEVARLELTYEDPGAASVTSMICKMPTSNEGFRFVGDMLGLYEKESGFYRDVAPEITLRIPTCYANLQDGQGYALLLEDLAPMRPGDQLESCSLPEARMALAEVAKLHARWWQHERLADFEAWLPGPGSATLQVFEAGYIGGVDAFHQNWAHLVSTDVHQLVDRAAVAYHAMIDAGPGREPHTFIHGDFRLDNMMFGTDPDEPSLALLDFQLPFQANAMWDVIYFLAGNFEPEWRLEHQDELLAHYHSCLVERGVDGYDLEQCREDYRASALVLLGYLVTSAADIDLETLSDRGRELIETMFKRYGSAIDDLGAAEFMP